MKKHNKWAMIRLMDKILNLKKKTKLRDIPIENLFSIVGSYRIIMINELFVKHYMLHSIQIYIIDIIQSYLSFH